MCDAPCAEVNFAAHRSQVRPHVTKQPHQIVRPEVRRAMSCKISSDTSNAWGGGDVRNQASSMGETCMFFFSFRKSGRSYLLSPLDQDLLRGAVLDQRLEDESHGTAVPTYPRR